MRQTGRISFNKRLWGILLATIIASSFSSTRSTGKDFDPKIDSLITELPSLPEDTIKAIKYYDIAWGARLFNPDTGLHYAKRGIDLSNKLKYKNGLYTNYNALGGLYWYKGELDKAEDNYHLALEQANLLNSIFGISTATKNLGLISASRGDYDKALHFIYKSLLQDEKRSADKDTVIAREGRVGVGYNLNYIAAIYYYQESYESAYENYEKAKNIWEALGSELEKSHNISGMGLCLLEQQEFDKALINFSDALEICEKINNQIGIANNLNDIGVVYLESGQYIEAYDVLIKANVIFKETNNTIKEIACDQNLAHALLGLGRLDEAEPLALSAVKVAKELDAKYVVIDGNETLSAIYAKQGEFKKALDAFKEYSSFKDSLFNESKSKEIGRLEAKFDFEKTEQEKSRLEAEKLSKSAQEKNRRDNLQFSGIFIFLVILGVGVVALSKLSIPVKLAEGLVFFSFLLFFEFLLVLLDPMIESYSGGAPAYKLLFNAVLAGMIFPLHAFLEKKITERAS